MVVVMVEVIMVVMGKAGGEEEAGVYHHGDARGSRQGLGSPALPRPQSASSVMRMRRRW